MIGVAAAVSVCLASLAPTPTSATPTPGPVARAGIAVDRAVGAARDEVAEAMLVARLRVALLERLGTDGLRVHVEVDGEQVSLSGEVSQGTSVERAGQVAKSLSAGRRLTNGLRAASGIGPNGPNVADLLGKAERDVADALVEARVKANLLDQLGRVGFGIEVEVADGVVVLTGTVPDSDRRVLAARIASRTPRVAEVRNRLKTTS